MRANIAPPKNAPTMPPARAPASVLLAEPWLALLDKVAALELEAAASAFAPATALLVVAEAGRLEEEFSCPAAVCVEVDCEFEFCSADGACPAAAVCPADVDEDCPEDGAFPEAAVGSTELSVDSGASPAIADGSVPWSPLDLVKMDLVSVSWIQVCKTGKTRLQSDRYVAPYLLHAPMHCM